MPSLSFQERLNLRLHDPIVDDIDCLLQISQSPGRFDSPKEFREHLSEGALLNINKLGSQALAIPSGEYMVRTTNSGHTILMPITIKPQNKEIYPEAKDQYDIMTPTIMAAWNVLERVLAEEMDPGFGENEEETPSGQFDTDDRNSGGVFSGGIDMSTVDRTPIARALEERGMTETELANICGVDVPAISRILREPKDTQGDPGGRNPSMELASKICAALRLDPKAAFPDFFKVNAGHAAREQPGNRGSGMSGSAGGSQRRKAATSRWTQGG